MPSKSAIAPVSSRSSSLSASSTSFDVSSHCVGSPHNMAASSSGSIQLLISLQEDVIFLASPLASSPSSYREHDNGVDSENNESSENNEALTNQPTNLENAENAETPTSLSAVLSASSTSNDPSRRRGSTSSISSRRNLFRLRRDSTSSMNNTNPSERSPSNGRHASESPHRGPKNKKFPKHIQNMLRSSIDPHSSASDLPPAVLRGSLVMKLSKPTKIKSVSLKFSGKVKTSWVDSCCYHEYDVPLATGPEFQEEIMINSHTWEFVPTRSSDSDPSSIVNLDGFSVVSSDVLGADVAYIHTAQNANQPASILKPGLHLKTPIHSSSSSDTQPQHSVTPVPTQAISSSPSKKPRTRWPFRKEHPTSTSPLSVTSSSQDPQPSPRRPSRTGPQLFSLNDIPFFTPNYLSPGAGSGNPKSPAQFSASADSATLYPAGEYVFHFTLAIDARTAETISCSSGSISYQLEAKVSRPSRFSFSTTGTRPITLVRSPPDCSETVSDAPITVSRNWDNRLHYEITCPQKYVPLGSAVPLSIRLTPIDKIQVHRIRVQVLEYVSYSSSQPGSAKHVDPIRKVILFQKRASSQTDQQKDIQSQNSDASGGKDGKADKGAKAKKKRMAGNIVNYLMEQESRVASMVSAAKPGNSLAGSSYVPKNSVATANVQSLEGEVLSTTTDIDCKLNFISPDSSWDAMSSHHFINPAFNSNYFQFLRPDAVYNPFIHVKHRLQIAFRISKQDSSDVKRRYFEVLIDTPIFILSKHCKTESVELPMYESIVTNPVISPDHDSWLDSSVDSASGVGAINIPGALPPLTQTRSNASGVSDFGSPLVRAVSSDLSASPEYEGLYKPFSNTGFVNPPSFNDALNDPLLVERPANSNVAAVVSASPGYTSLNRVLSESVSDENASGQRGSVLTQESVQELGEEAIAEPLEEAIESMPPTQHNSSPSDSLACLSSASSITSSDLPATSIHHIPHVLENDVKLTSSDNGGSATPLLPTYADIIHETVPLLNSSASSSVCNSSQVSIGSGLSNMSLSSSGSSAVTGNAGPTSSIGVGIGINSSSRYPSTTATTTTIPSIRATTNHNTSQYSKNIQCQNSDESEMPGSLNNRDESSRFDYYMRSIISSRFGEPGL